MIVVNKCDLDSAQLAGKMQREYERERSRRYVGRGLLWSSIAPIIAGQVCRFPLRGIRRSRDF